MISPFQAVKRVFFDLDDTLCGYWDASKAALLETFEAHGPDGHSPEDMVGHWAAAFREFSPTIKRTGWYPTYLKQGEPTRTEQMRLTLRRVGIEDEERAKRLSESYGDKRNANLFLFEDARVVLEAFATRYPMGLITNGPADIQRQEIETLGIGHFFDRVYIEGETGRGKPLPDLFEDITREAGLSPEEIAMVGNSYAHDVQPALVAGWVGIWIRRPSDVPPSAHGMTARVEERPAEAPEPTATISTLSDLLPMFGLDSLR